MTTQPTKAERIVAALLFDFTDRRGLRQAWEWIDEDVREEILETWRHIVAEELSKP